MRERPEILAPAGDPGKLATALHFGADAVYLGVRGFSMRSAAGSFDDDELAWAITHAHQRGRRVYVALNIQPFDSDFAGLEATARRLAVLGPDAVIVADPGVLDLVRREAPSLPLHLSTQASVTNSAAARWWLEQGLERIIVARELDLDRVAAIAAACPGRIEAFVHGAVCIAYSGRCLLSLYWAGRDTRRGECTQACRWPYREIEDRRRPGEPNPVVEDERGTHFFDAKDLCALPVLDRLVATGVAALKIEGRTRSADYVGITTDVYRHAVDLLADAGPEAFEAELPRLLGEVSRPRNRGFSTHFLDGEEDLITSYNPSGSFADGRTDYLGRVVAIRNDGLVVEAVNPIREGDTLEIRDRGLLSETCTPAPLLGADGGRVEIIRSGERSLLTGAFEAGVGALVRRAAPPLPETSGPAIFAR